jgi:hypothetical protein
VLSGGILFGYTMLPMLQVAAQGMWFGKLSD